jgi:hypothetical protein
MRRLILSALTLSLLFVTCVTSRAQSEKRLIQGNGTGEEGSVRYHYLFENERFTTPLQEVEFDGSGKGEFRFKRKESEEVVNKIEVSTSVLSQLSPLFDELNFLSSSEDYQHKKDFSHLGKITITFARGGKVRTVSFNYSDNQSLNKITEIFRNIVTQETRVFEIETIRTSDPISTPAQLRLLESELRSKHIADPQRLVPMLQDIKLDESVPLIARNHADRLLQMIKKGK